MNKSMIALLALIASPMAQAQVQGDQPSDRNNWNSTDLSIDAAATVAENRPGETSAVPGILVRYESVVGNDNRVEATGGVSPIEYLNVQYEYTVGDYTKGDINNSTYILFPLIGGIQYRPGSNMIKPNMSENLSTTGTYFGIGKRFGGSMGQNSSFRAAVEFKYVAVDEMLTPGTYTSEGADINGRESVNMIEAKGWTTRFKAQFAIADKLLLGVDLQGTWASETGTNNDGNEVIRQYFDRSGRLVAEWAVNKTGRVKVSILGSYYTRLTNLTDLRTNRSVEIPSLGVRLRFGGRR